MKKLYLVLLVFGVSIAQAQIYDEWKNEIESIFQYVNRSHVTTGLLTDSALASNYENKNAIIIFLISIQIKVNRCTSVNRFY